MVNMKNTEKNSKEKVLLLDDDEFLLNMYKVKFTNAGYDVKTSNSGRNAITQLEDGLTVSAVIFDIVMPTMNGLEFLDEVKKKKLAKEASFIALTNQGQSSDVEEAKKLGADGYIVKASTIPSEVVEEVEKIIKRHKK
ncbi:MAG: hypothetical protein COV70_03915 [Parcubacteria group bacterium CG11_big_fil_rev_8_21_14_0_20_39_22]|nr:MAG: hypothetical protein COV70_03915 [Parcubacteria group bacterium CG11_big_fil_rev_8_21_14_0_20_39_22]